MFGKTFGDTSATEDEDVYNTPINTHHNRVNSAEVSRDSQSAELGTKIQSTDSSDGFGSSSELHKLRMISEVYDDTEEVEMADELMLMGVDEPVNYCQA